MALRRLSILRKGLLVIALPLAYQAILLGVLFKQQQEHTAAQRDAVHSKEVLVQIDRVEVLAIEGQGALRGVLLTDDPMLDQRSREAVALLMPAVDVLAKLLARDREQMARVARLREAVQARIAWHLASQAEMQGGRKAVALERTRSLEGEKLMRRLRDEADALRREEQRIDTLRGTALARSMRVQNIMLTGGLVCSIIVGAAAVFLFSRGVAGRVAVLAENVQRTARGERLVPPVEGNDEVSDLDVAFHSMSERLLEMRFKEREANIATERRSQELLRTNRELDLKNQESETFVYSVSHDLRSPLVNLQGFSKELSLVREELKEILEGESTEASRARAKLLVNRDMPESIEFIQTAVTRLSGIIDAILRLSRMGRVEFHPEMIDLKPILDRILTSMHGSIAERGASIVRQELPPVWGDPTALEQIFANLLSNAVNYLDPARPGAIEIGVLANARPGMETMTTYFVKDNGLGIAEAHLPKVFAIFQRLHAKSAPGEGVGLALVRRVVQRHGGEIWVESQKGVGSTFLVALPRRESSPLTVAPRKESISILSRFTRP